MRSTRATAKPGAAARDACARRRASARACAAAMSSDRAAASHTAWWCGVVFGSKRAAALPSAQRSPTSPALRERVERVVDGREAHRRERRAEPLEELLRRRVRLVVGEELATIAMRCGVSLSPARLRSREHRLRAGGADPPCSPPLACPSARRNIIIMVLNCNPLRDLGCLRPVRQARFADPA